MNGFLLIVFQNLKKEHTVLSDQVELTTDSYHVPQVQLLSESPMLILEILAPLPPFFFFFDLMVIDYVAFL